MTTVFDKSLDIAELIEPGLYPGVDALAYHEWPGASQSRLKVLRDKSPAHVRYQMDHPEQPTDAQRLGAAVHTAVLEPDVFPNLYVRGIAGDGRTKAVKEARDALEAEYPDHVILKPDIFDQCLAIRDAVRAHPHIGPLLDGEHECSAVWRDEATGVLCRGRFDAIARRVGAITDLKTTTDASPYRFPRDLFTYGYHIQAAMYLRGARALGIDADSFAIAVVEKEPPYAVAVYQLTGPAVADGERELDALLPVWAECERTGVWPSYPTDVVQIDLPKYAPLQISERLGVGAG